MSVLGTTKHSSCNQCIDTWQYSYIVYCIVLYLTKMYIIMAHKNVHTKHCVFTAPETHGV